MRMQAMAMIVAATLLAGAARAAEWHVAPTGKPAGAGTAADPWDLVTALQHPAQVQPGDTIWLHGGSYTGEARETFTSKLKGTAEKPIVVRQWPGERATVGPTLSLEGEYAWFWGFEIVNPDTAQYARTEHARLPTVWLRNSRNIKLINLVIHGGGQGIGAWSESTDTEIFGCIIYHNGWEGSNQGHGIYTQNKTGTKQILDNIIFNQLGDGYGIHAYGSDKAFINNFHFEGNVAFGNQGNNILVGGGSPSENIVVQNNFAYAGNGVQFGYGAHSKNIALRDNYFATRCTVKNWDDVTFQGNTVLNADKDRFVQLIATDLPALPKYAWDRNTYHFAGATPTPFNLTTAVNGQPTTAKLSFEQWQEKTGYDAASTMAGAAKGPKVFVRPNRYEPGRANIIVYNWDNAAAVEVDVAALLKPGDRYEVRDAQNWFGEPVIAGTYAGGALRLPMKLTQAAQPVTPQRFEHTPSEFAVFVLLTAAAGAGR